MGIYTVSIDRGGFVDRGKKVTRVSEQTNFHIFAADRESAKTLALHYVGERIGLGSSIESQATFDDVSGWVERAETNGHLSLIEAAVEEAARFIGTIVIESFAVVSPEHHDDLLIISLAEHEKKRCLLKSVQFAENGSVEWVDDIHPFNHVTLATAIQNMF